jgi:site-specific DNA-methyltransferase (adenine-specific)
MKERAGRNQTLNCSPEEIEILSKRLRLISEPTEVKDLANHVLCQPIESATPFLPFSFVDLLVIDPPYNLTKNYHGHVFREQDAAQYSEWFEGIISNLIPILRPDASVYVCSDWRTSTLIFPILEKHFTVRNRITWEREKGRGAKSNWKNNTEDIWYCTRSDEYTFNVDDVKLKRKVLAPYRTDDGSPKDWEESQTGGYRLTHPSNIWSDITIPFWSMPENTDHPTQKPEKLIAKLILASSNPGDMVFDPFLGSGTTAVVAQKLNRQFCGVEMNKEYCCWALKRLNQAKNDPSIQGYSDGVFWERNTLNEQVSQSNGKVQELTLGLFE